MSRKLRHVSPSLVAITAEGFLSRLSFGLISFALPLYARHLGLSLVEVGLLISLNLGVMLALKPAMGWAADRFGSKRSLTVAISLRSLVALLLAFVGSPWQLYAVRTAHGMSMSLRDPSVNVLIAEHSGKRTIASAFAWYSTAKSVAGSLGQATAGVLLTATGSNFSLVFLVASFLSVLPLYVVGRYVQEGNMKNEAAMKTNTVSHGRFESSKSKENEATIKTVKTVTTASYTQDARISNVTGQRPALLPFIGLGFLMSGAAHMLHGLFPILAMEYAGLSEAETGIIYMVSTLILLLSGPLFGWLSDHVSRKLVLLVRSGANTLSSIVYIAAPNLLGVATGKFVDDMGKAAFRPAWGALMAYVSSFDRPRRAQTMSLMSLGEDAGEIAGPILAGLLWSTSGITAVLWARVLLAIVAESYAVILAGSLEKPKVHRSLGGRRAGVPDALPRDD